MAIYHRRKIKLIPSIINFIYIRCMQAQRCNARAKFQRLHKRHTRENKKKNQQPYGIIKRSTLEGCHNTLTYTIHVYVGLVTSILFHPRVYIHIYFFLNRSYTRQTWNYRDYRHAAVIILCARFLQFMLLNRGLSLATPFFRFT